MKKIILIAIIIGAVICAIIAAAVWRIPSPRASVDWEQMRPMKTGRSEISAALMGGKVYIAGGIGFFKTLRSCEVYHIADNEWTTCPKLPEARHHVALASDGENIFAAGGYTELNFTPETAPKLWRLSEAAGAWEAVSDLPEAIGEHAMITRGGALYLIGGRSPDGDSAALCKYDIAANVWSNLAALPVPRHSFAAFMAEGELWVTGGRSAALGTRIDRIDIYNFTANEWRQGPTLPAGRGGHAGAYTDGRVHIIGGEVFDPTILVDRHDIYDVEAGVWHEGPLMPAPRHGMTAIAHEGGIYVLGGGARPAVQTAFSASPSVQKYPAVTRNTQSNSR